MTEDKPEDEDFYRLDREVIELVESDPAYFYATGVLDELPEGYEEWEDGLPYGRWKWKDHPK